MTSLYVLTCDALAHSSVSCPCGAVSRACDYSGADRIETHGQAAGLADALAGEGWRATETMTRCPSCAPTADWGGSDY